MASRQHYISMAKQLPPRLQRFLARYPPPSILPDPPSVPPAVAAVPGMPATAAASPPATGPNGGRPTPRRQPQPPPKRREPIFPTGYQLDRGGASPFRYWKHPETGKWHDPVYSLRRQADLIKMARQHGIEELLPSSAAGTDADVQRRVESGLRVKGTGVGERVKGHIYERMRVKKMQVRRKAMLRMPWLISRWRAKGKRRWRLYPKKPSPMS